MPTAVLVPIKGFSSAKARLERVLGPDERADLARRLATRVLDAVGGLPTLVVCDDDEVAAFAADRGVSTLRQDEPGLNAAVTEGVACLAAEGYDLVVVAHADLPRAATLDAIVDLADGARRFDDEPGAVVLVPDRHGDGTNVLVVPTTAGFRFQYGPGSADAHRAESERLGLQVVVVHDPDLAWDVDTPDDLGPTREVSEPDRSAPG